jgi:hypothetical protein
MAITSAGVPVSAATQETKQARVERRKNIAEVIVRRRSIAERLEPAQKIKLLLAEPRNIHEGALRREPRPDTVTAPRRANRSFCHAGDVAMVLTH